MLDMNDPEIVESLKYLLIPQADKIKAQAQPFDGKKACWIPEHKEGFIAAEIISTKGEEVTVKTSKGETVTVKKDDVQQMNPPKYDRCDDMADLTYLNDASVLCNLRERYRSWFIYVSIFFQTVFLSTTQASDSNLYPSSFLEFHLNRPTLVSSASPSTRTSVCLCIP